MKKVYYNFKFYFLNKLNFHSNSTLFFPDIINTFKLLWSIRSFFAHYLSRLSKDLTEVWLSLTVMGDGLSVIKFLRAPKVTLFPRRAKAPSESFFSASLTVIGDGLSVIKFLRAPKVTLFPRSAKAPSLSFFWARTSSSLLFSYLESAAEIRRAITPAFIEIEFIKIIIIISKMFKC